MEADQLTHPKWLAARAIIPWLFAAFLLAAAGCTLDLDPTATSVPASSPLPPVVAPPAAPLTISPATAAPAADGWEQIAPGLERRSFLPGNDALSELIAIRVDPALYTFRAHYRPGEPLSVRAWQDELPNAVLFVNANFFDPQYRITGMLIADGVVYGEAYIGRGGMFAVQNGVPQVRSNTTQPYAGEALEQAVQAFPMLVLDGVPAFTTPDNDRSRRTIVAQDDLGRIVLMVTPAAGLTLTDLSAYLASLEIGLVNAFNLDGGRSTMLSLTAGTQPVTIASFEAVPAVLAVYAR